MPKKLKILISAYACEPNKGSEPEVGWQWALQMARFHDVTVLTRVNNREAIEKELVLLRGTRPLPNFVYHDDGTFWLWIKSRFHAVRLYYVIWQISAWKVIRRLQKETPFDVLHHVTFAGFRYRTAIWNQGVASVWGPVGGVESIPWPLLPWKHPTALVPEVLRNINNFIQAAPFHVLPKRAQTTTVTLVSTEEMEHTFLNLGLEVTLMPTIGLHVEPMPPRRARAPGEPLKMLFVGNLITLKGIDLALEAFKRSGINGTFTLVGTGAFGEAFKNLAERLGIADRVNFRGRLPRQETLKLYSDFDLFIFPSLHDTGGYALIEAMACGLPALCLDCGGPRVAVKNGAGTRVPLGSRQQVINRLAEAMRRYDTDRELLAQHGAAAREVIERDYDWDKKGHQLSAVYEQAFAENAAHASRSQAETKRGAWGVFRRLFPVRSLTVSAAILLIIGTAGFFSLNYLKHNATEIVEDTLPTLSDAGAANSSLAEAFNRTLLLVLADTPEERAAYRQELNRFSQQTTDALAVYQHDTLAPEDRAIYNEVLQRRSKYLTIRQQVLKLIDADKREEALTLAKGQMLTAYLEYKFEAEKLLKFNTRQGKTRGEAILNICTATQYVVAGIGILLFAVGFLLGFFK